MLNDADERRTEPAFVLDDGKADFVFGFEEDDPKPKQDVDIAMREIPTPEMRRDWKLQEAQGWQGEALERPETARTWFDSGSEDSGLDRYAHGDRSPRPVSSIYSNSPEMPIRAFSLPRR